MTFFGRRRRPGAGSAGRSRPDRRTSRLETSISWPDDEYATLDVVALWPVLSLLCFVAALTSRFWVGWLPLRWGLRALLSGLAVPALSLLGLLLALPGLRHPRSRGLTKVALLVNSVGVVLGGLVVWVFFFILRGYR